MNDSSSTTRYQVDDLYIDVGRGTVCRDGAEVELSQLSFSLLLRLVEADGGIVTLETLMSDVWPGVVVTPETVSQRIKIVRNALGDDAQKPRYIAGVRGRGYRIVARISRLDSGATPARDEAASSHVANGFPWRWIAAAAAVAVGIAIASLVTGLFALREARTGTIDADEIRSAVMSAIETLDLPLSTADMDAVLASGSSDALDVFLRGISGAATSIGGPIDAMDQALALDPDFAPAHAVKAFLLSQTLVTTVFAQGASPRRSQDIERGIRRHAGRALDIYPQSGIAHTALGNVDFYHWRWRKAEDEFAKGLSGAVGESLVPYLLLMSYQGRHDEAIDLGRRIVELNPGVGGMYGHLGIARAYAGRYAEAAEDLALALQTSASPVFRSTLISIELARGNRDTAREMLEKYFPGFPGAVPAYLKSRIESQPVGQAVESLRERDARGEAVGAGTWAMAYLAAGDEKAALEQLAIAADIARNHEIDEGFFAVLNLKMNLAGDPLLEEPEFVDVLARIRAD